MAASRPSRQRSTWWPPGPSLGPPIQGLEEAGYLTSTTAMELTEVPDSLLVLVVATWPWSRRSCSPARVDGDPAGSVRLASKEESEVSKALQEVFADEGIRVVRERSRPA